MGDEEASATVYEEDELLQVLAKPFTSLVLSCDFSGEVDEESLAAALRNSSLTWVDFDHSSGATSTVQRALFKALMDGNATLRSISGVYVDCDDATGRVLAEALRTNHTLESLAMDELGQHWTQDTARVVLEGLSSNHGVKEFVLTSALLPDQRQSAAVTTALGAVFQTNTTLHSLRLDDMVDLSPLHEVLPLWKQHPSLTSVSLYRELGQPGAHALSDFNIHAALQALNPTPPPSFTGTEAPCCACGEIRQCSLYVVILDQDPRAHGTLSRRGACSVACADRAKQTQAAALRAAWEAGAQD